MRALRGLFALGFWLAGSAMAQAPAKPVYAVLSVIGDKVDVVVPRSLPGEEQAAVRGAVTVKEGVFDAVAVDAASRAIWAVAPKTEIAQLSARGNAIYQRQAEWFAERDGRIRIPQEVLDSTKQQAATHLVLLLKHRAPVVWTSSVAGASQRAARFRGLGEGLGFIVDVPAGADGDIVPFAHFQVLVVDLATQTVIGRNPVAAAVSVPVEAASADLAWRSFTAWQKARVMEFLIRDQAGQAVQSLFELIATPN
ncbi:MAG: hypothetical protein JNK75_05005 [Betaproteobacteria bacterium]|nr:hypothetical protein [Betaproteobacteria bacterium]